MFKNKYAANNPGVGRSRKKLFLIVGGIIVVAALVLAALELTNTTHLLHTAPEKVIVKTGKSSPPPKNNSSASSNTAKNATSANRDVSGGTDTSGTARASTSSSQWIVSKSGNITVKQPLTNAKIQSGAVLSGSAKVGQVRYRLIDDKVGVLSEGIFNVVNGNFSGTVNFAPQASTGRLDVFSADSSGVELNEVQIAVRF